MKKALLVVLLFVILMVPFVCCTAETVPYNRVIVSSADMQREQAEKLAIDYYNKNTYRRVNNEDFSGIDTVSGRYTINSVFIHIQHKNAIHYAWAVSFFDKEKIVINSPSSHIGTVMIDSPSGEILFFADEELFDGLNQWEEFFGIPHYSGSNSIHTIEIVESIVCPPDMFGARVLPGEYDISPVEAETIAVNMVAGMESIEPEDVKSRYIITSSLAHYPGILPENVWCIKFYKDENSPEEYKAGVYSSHGKLWYLAKWDRAKALTSVMHDYDYLYINNTYCHKEIIDVRNLPYGDWGGFIDVLFALDIPESDYLKTVFRAD